MPLSAFGASSFDVSYSNCKTMVRCNPSNRGSECISAAWQNLFVNILTATTMLNDSTEPPKVDASGMLFGTCL
jgi:hypothetical protein